jgi:hypothetical protein
MKICIVGGKGNMATRYRCILSMLGVDSVSWDIDENHDLSDVTGFIVATPTPTHFDVLQKLLPMQKPILCEKPVTKSKEELETIGRLAALYNTPFTMVAQYCWLVDPALTGPSHYDYFKHGPDGMPWDMFQIISLAKQEVQVGETSPVWDCMINGQQLNLAAMDFAYIEMMRSWLQNPSSQPWDFIETCHRKVREYAKENPDSHTGS